MPILHESPPRSVNLQLQSPLYNGSIPAEIRTAIFDYALTESLITVNQPNSFMTSFPFFPVASLATQFLHQTPAGDYIPTNTYRRNSHYSRPGYTGRKIVHTALLSTCWRVYLETYHLPPAKKEHVFWHARGPPNHFGSTLSHHGEQEYRYFDMFTPWQMSFIKEIHLFTQMFWLEKVFPRMVTADFMQGLEKITITIRRGDWWMWEDNKSLGISPQMGHGDPDRMANEWAVQRKGESVSWKEDSWGSAFQKMRNLKVIQLELETSSDKLDELVAIVDHSRSWIFPAWSSEERQDMVFYPEKEHRLSTWESPSCYWSSSCGYCGRDLMCVTTKGANPGCIDRTSRKRADVGPLCYMTTLRWKLAMNSGRS